MTITVLKVPDPFQPTLTVTRFPFGSIVTKLSLAPACGMRETIFPMPGLRRIVSGLDRGASTIQCFVKRDCARPGSD
jgi:hypothetical protein